MQVVRVCELPRHVQEEVAVQGWLYHKRSSGKLRFLVVRDGSGIVQAVVFKGDVTDAVFEATDLLTQESSLTVVGVVREDARSPGGVELQVRDIRIHQIAQDYPITPKEHGSAFLMDHRHLWIRSSKQVAILRVRHRVIRAIRDFFDDRGFVLVDAPIFTPAACEGTTTLFETDYFGSKAYLTQSGQLYMEAAAMAFGKVYCFGPTFRAEKSKTRRHLTEFWMVEPEVAYLDLDGDMALAEAFVSYLIERVLAECRQELEVLGRDTAPLERIKPPFPRISYDEAVDLLRKKGHAFEYGNDFGAPDETAISESFDRPVMVHRYPAEVKAFYMKKDPTDPTKALCVDMLAPEGVGEIIGGGQREDDYDTLLESIQKHGLPIEAFKWYLDLRKYGSVPHAGFGLGLERTVGWICGTPHIRECIPFPRMLHRLTP